MKNISTIAFAILIAFAVTSQGFQCGSPEFSGAKLRIQQKDYKGAIKLLETEVKKNPNNEEAWFLLGELDADQGDYTGMNTAFDQALKINNKHSKEIHSTRYGRWGQRVNSGVTFLGRAGADSTQFYDSAATEFRTAILIWPDTSLTFKYLGIAYNNKADYEKALDAFKTAWEIGKDLEALKRVGKIYFAKGAEFDTKFETDNADSLRISKNLAEIKVGSHKNDVMAAFGAPDEVKKAEAVKKGRKPAAAKGGTREVWKYKALGLTLEVENDRVASVTKPREPAIDSTYHYKALAMYDSAETVFEKVKEVDPKDNENLTYLLEAYVKSGRIKEAIKTFRIAVENDPNNKTNHYILGILLRTDGDFPSAVSEFKTALTLDPSYSDALYDIGATLYNWGVDIIKKAQASGKE
ncbi:MAG TPA: tetratricopeptide repeat protein, partial [Bacteroidota bacterium]